MRLVQPEKLAATVVVFQLHQTAESLRISNLVDRILARHILMQPSQLTVGLFFCKGTLLNPIKRLSRAQKDC